MARFKIVFFGKQGCGKTQLSHQIALKGDYEENAPSTVGVEFLSRKIDENNTLSIWDITGNELYKKLDESYYKDAIVGLMCVDLTNKIDEKQINNEIQLFRAICPNTPIIIVGTKADSSNADIDAFAKINSNQMFSKCITSAKVKDGIQELYGEIITHCQRLNESLLNRAISNLLVKLNTLPNEKERLIKAELATLSKVLIDRTSNPTNKAEAIENFTNNCTTILEGKHPNVLKAIISVAVAAIVSLVSACIGFTIGFSLGVWSGPGALVTGLISGAAATVVPPSVCIGAMTGSITAYGLFKPSPEKRALNEFTAEIRSWNNEIRL